MTERETRYFNAVAVRLAVQDFGLFFSLQADMKPVDPASAEFVLYLSPVTAKMLAGSLNQALAAYELSAGQELRITFDEARVRDSVEQMKASGLQVETRTSGERG